MRLLRLAALILAITGGYLGLSGGSASAAPVSSAPLAAATASVPMEYAQYYGRRRYYGRPRYYARPFYRPRVVCRIRYTAYGPRRFCFRRF